MAKQLVADEPKADQKITATKDTAKTTFQWSRYSKLPTTKDRKECLNSCRNLTNSIYGGLDLQLEINSVDTQGLGDTVLLWKDGDEVGEIEKRMILHYLHTKANTPNSILL